VLQVFQGPTGGTQHHFARHIVVRGRDRRREPDGIKRRQAGSACRR
jgi:hypothetical protein